MAIAFLTPEWITALGQHLNGSASYERSAKDWEGDFLFVIEPDGTKSELTHYFLGLYHGKCTAAEKLTRSDEKPVEFRVSGPLPTWRLVVEGKLDPIQAMMSKKLKLEGNLMKIMRYPKAAKEIISCCALVPTTFPE